MLDSLKQFCWDFQVRSSRNLLNTTLTRWRGVASEAVILCQQRDSLVFLNEYLPGRGTGSALENFPAVIALCLVAARLSEGRVQVLRADGCTHTGCKSEWCGRGVADGKKECQEEGQKGKVHYGVCF